MHMRRLLFSVVAVVAGLGLAVGLTGCNAIRVGLGMRVHLAKLPVTTMEASLPNNPGIAPSESSPLVVTLTEPSGKIWKTEGKGKGKILWADLVVTPSVVTVNKKGVLRLAGDPRKSDGKTGHVEISAPSHPELHAALDIPLRYNFPFVANYSGASGSSGSNGTDGSSGSSGSAGSMDPDSPSAGGNGGDGGDGTNGGDGGDGGDAPNVQAWVTLRAGAHPLLQAKVSAGGRKDRYYLVDPQGGTLKILAEGGAGGAGGRGGSGGSGGSGGIGSPNGSDGRSGSNGSNGSSGSDGRAGTITITYDSSVKPYLSMIHTSNRGAPAPTYLEAPVEPLW